MNVNYVFPPSFDKSFDLKILNVPLRAFAIYYEA